LTLYQSVKRRSPAVDRPLNVNNCKYLAMIGCYCLLARRVLCWTLLVCVGLCGRAAAEGGHFDSENFHRTPMAGGYLAVDSAYPLPHFGLTGLYSLSYEHAPLVFRDPDGKISEGGEVIGQRLAMEFGLSMSLLEHFEVALSLPFVPYQTTDGRLLDPPVALRGHAVGDLRLDVKVLVHSFQLSGGREFGLGLLAGVTFPTATADVFFGQDGLTARPRLVTEWRSRSAQLALNVGGVFRGSRHFAGLWVTSQLSLGLATRVRLPVGFFVQAEADALIDVGLPRAAGAFKQTEAPVEVWAGFGWRSLVGLVLDVSGGAGLTTGYGTPEGRLLVGLRYAHPLPMPPMPGDRDPDHDGVPTRLDHCPSVPGSLENDGCPDIDGDGDGIIDRLDRCPDQQGPAETAGCPESDSDGDGVVDRLDRCPDRRGGASNGGCPEGAEARPAPETQVECPPPPGAPENPACVEPDSDDDGIVDRLDRCPSQPEVYNGEEDDDGCPEATPPLVSLMPDRIVLFAPITFADRDTLITPRGELLLKLVAKILLRHPEITKIRIEGHTDNVGSALERLDRSRLQAVLVRRWLLDRGGIESRRLVAQGFGGSQPVADNRTPKGRMRNRRIEFVIVDRAPAR
jgi:outer membrane protein OmpA-like peptidoglycan-associated protein